jgi:thiol-disulfide isomerase/thioredoxin
MKTILPLVLAAALLITASCDNKKAPAPQADTKTEATAQTADASSDTIADFTLNTPDGSPLSVMSEVKKHDITIIDFWASWCGPCMREMPFMKQLYADFRDKGLGIVGISLDEDRDAWQKAIDSMGLTWPQMSDLQGWDAVPARMYNVNAIPFLMVVDRQGLILTTGLRGDELRQYISEKL